MILLLYINGLNSKMRFILSKKKKTFVIKLISSLEFILEFLNNNDYDLGKVSIFQII